MNSCVQIHQVAVVESSMKRFHELLVAANAGRLSNALIFSSSVLSLPFSQEATDPAAAAA